MHAASVHPEPGSNSRTNCISTVSGQHQVCRACGSFYFLSMHPVLSGCVSKNDEIFALASFLLVLKSPVVQLSMINRGFDSVLAFLLPVLPRLSRGQLTYYITFASTCQEVFKTFFQSFLWPFRFRCALISSACLLYHLHRQKSTLFWKVFFIRYLCPIYLTVFQQYTATCTVARPFFTLFYLLYSRFFTNN